MTVGVLLAIVCILLGFLGPILDEKILIGVLDWFVAAIAIVMTLGGVGPVVWGGKKA